MRRPLLVFTAALGFASGLTLDARSAQGHGGVDASAFLLDPGMPGVVVDERFRFTWADASDVGLAQADTSHDFFFTRSIPRPWPIFAAPPDLTGTPIARNIPETATENTVTWSTSTVAAGAYWIWSIAKDPDLLTPAASIVFSPFPVVVAHPGDPVHPFVTLETPDGPAAFAEDERYDLEYVAFDPDGTGRVRVERARDGAGAFTLVAEDLPADEDGTYRLDTTGWEAGDWILRATIEDGRGLSFSSFARYTLLVARAAPRPDAGVSEDAGRGDVGETPDAGRPDGALPAATPPDGDGCRCGARRSGGALGGAVLAGLGALLLGLARRKRGEVGIGHRSRGTNSP